MQLLAFVFAVNPPHHYHFNTKLAIFFIKSFAMLVVVIVTVTHILGVTANVIIINIPLCQHFLN